MKQLSTYIIEWKANTDNMSSIEKQDIQYFVYKVNIKNLIKIFDEDWTQFEYYKDKVYINGEHVKLNDHGRTTKLYNPGTYIVEIKDIDNVNNCQYMFSECDQLVSVPLFDTSKVKNMKGMFFNCKNLEEVSTLDTSNVNIMYNMFKDCEKLKNVPLFDIKNAKIDNMFKGCNTLSDETKKEWSKVYNFDTHKKI